MGTHRWQPFRRRGVGLTLCGLALLAAGLLGWREFHHSRRPNVLLITLDTTRADRVGCYGYAPALTPVLDALAAEGVLFERALTPAPLTLPSHASMMTGLYPREHGLITNGRGRLDESIPTLAEDFHRGGYDTAGFVGSFVLHTKFGLQRGFAVYDDDMTHTDPTEDGMHRQRDGERVVNSALKWLQEPRKKPFFCWVHLYDPHAPYASHADKFGDRFQDHPYDGEIAYIDRQIGRLMEVLDKSRFREQTLIVVVGDHGESLGEHDEEAHGLTLYDSVLHVPWIWTGRGATAAGRRVPQPVSLVDLRPTLLETVGLRHPGGTSGRSLRAALSGGALGPRECYAATDEPLLAQGWSPLRSLTVAGWKYIRSPEPELYDLTSDPHESRNLAADRVQQVQELEAQLVSMEKSLATRQAAAVELSERERQALSGLGYVGGRNALPPVAEGKPLPTVKRMLPFHNRVVAAYRLMFDGDAPAAERRLRELARESPDNVRVRLYLASVLEDQKRFDESRDVLEGVLDQDPDNGDAHFQLGTVCRSQQKYGEAAEEFRKSLAAEPDAARSLFNLAKTLVKLGQVEEAEQFFREALEQDPAYVSAHLSLGILLAGQRRTAEAERHFREALEYTPGSVELHLKLAVLLMEQNRLAEAEEHFARTRKLSPKDAELHFNHGTILFMLGRFDEAIGALEEALRLNPQHARAEKRLKEAHEFRKR